MLTLKDFLFISWYVQPIIVIDYHNGILHESANIEKIKESALYSGINHDLKADNELMNRYVYSYGAIDDHMIIEVR